MNDRRVVPMGSPYRPGMGLEPPYLGDRAEHLRRFRRFLGEPHIPRNVLVTGLRGVGKTVLLNHYTREAEAAGWAVAEREFSERETEPTVFARIVLSDLESLTRRLSLLKRVQEAGGKLAERAMEFVRSVRVSYQDLEVGLGPAGGEARERPRLDEDLREAMGQVGALCQAGALRGFILRYDEFHVVREQKSAPTISALLAAAAAVQQRSVPVMLVLCGLPPLTENLARAKSYTERMFTTEELRNLRPPEDRAALVDPARERGRTYQPIVVERVLADTAGHAYFIQFYGDALWNGASGSVITDADLERTHPLIVAELDRSFFSARFMRCTPRERRFLAHVAAFGESATIAQVEHASGLANNASQPLLAVLIRKGMLYRPERGRVAFAAPMFGAYVRRQLAAEST